MLNNFRPVREAWIRAKYIERRFVRKCSERARKSAIKRAKGFHRRTSGICKFSQLWLTGKSKIKREMEMRLN